MLIDFYVAFGTMWSTLPGLRIVVVQTGHAEWRRSVAHRRRAYGWPCTSRCPGLLSLADPASTAL